MKQVRLLLVVLLSSWCLAAVGQDDLVSGTVVDAVSEIPLQGVEINEVGWPLVVISDADGSFALTVHLADSVALKFRVEAQEYTIIFTASQVAEGNLGTIKLESGPEPVEDQFFTITLQDDDSGRNGENISGILSASRDVFESAAAFVFGPARFRIRGYNSENSFMNINGVDINDLEAGRVIWSHIGGLNDVMRNRESHIGVASVPFGFGGIGGAVQIDLRASRQRPQKRFTYSLTNRAYTHRLMGTWSTGMRNDGWAFTVSASRRWAQEGFIEGTSYDSYSYFVSIDKKLNDHHLLNLVVLGSPSQRGSNSAATLEMFEIDGTNYYNSYWGYQNGRKRNARFSNVHQPWINLRHDWTIRENSILTTSVAFQTGHNGRTALDWYNANDPRPDYYRRLPSYQLNPDIADQVYQKLSENQALRQIQWDQLYDVNRASVATIEDVDGIPGNDVTGLLSRYVVEDRRYDNTRLVAQVNLQHVVSPRFSTYAGLFYSWQKVHAFKELEDLMDGEFYVNFDRFAERDLPDDEDAIQNDLNNPNQLVRVGDVFGYDYDENINKYGIWGQGDWKFNKVDFFVGISAGQTSFWRTGNMRNGKFPENSFGDSEKYNFFDGGVKGGITYKVDGRNYLTIRGMFMQRAPFLRNALVSARTRNEFVQGLTEEKIYGGEASYILNSPNVRGRLTGYYTQFRDGLLTRSFYHDDERSFVNFSMRNIDKQHVGMEAAVELTLAPGLDLQGVVAIGQFIYNSRPLATVSQDNNAELLAEDLVVYAENFYVSDSPQRAYTVGLSYRSRNYWSFYLNANYFDDVWIDFNPVRRTSEAVDLVEEGSELWNSIIAQENTGGAFTLNASVFKSFLIDWFEDNVYFNISLSVNNVLNNRDYITGGYEQLRFDFEGKDVNRFPSRYYYFQGLNYYINASIRF